ncbi:phage-related integrase [Leifsonia xyli subsp. cynodontis DSM 46306]|uniref:Tyr recombinase domain-containing protein n=1 Tax=Leifsonia xyli subsp. cynodontis DSM 46306 TaxID=1389489 RepID=U3PBX1_LEIXC|nr:tyrosine-type recombinase/integrase [Leifsonia xyli]AGW40998.1 phage-related integrase [Leifsonia xyli subsp. cynodontis DSM 46306]
MATITPYDTAKGKRYRVRYRKPDGSQTDKRGFRTKREAELFAASVMVKRAAGEYIDPTRTRVTVESRAVPWLAGKKVALKPSAYRVLEITWRLHVEPQWGNVQLVRIEHSAVQEWVTKLSAKRSASVTLRAYGILAGILDVAVKDRRVVHNAARGVNLLRKGKKAHVYLTHEQVDALAREAGQHATLIRMLAYTGMRWGEASGLRVKHLDMLRRRLQIDENAVKVGKEVIVGTPKSHKARSVPFPQFLAEGLAKQCDGKTREQLVVGDGRNHITTPDWSGGWFVYAKKRSGVPIELTIHDLRHTAASLSIAAGANVKAVQRMLGHASAAMTLDVYGHLFDDDLDTVSAALHNAVRVSNVGKKWANR